jgi:3-oxoacyl-[acyl-carrier protein] reductase
MLPSPKTYSSNKLRVGLEEEFTLEVQQKDLLAYAEVSRDFNPLHVDPIYAATTNFGECIAHGALQLGYASAMLGMYLPGRYALLGGANAQFPSPLTVPTQIRVHGEITTWNRELNSGTLRVTISEAKNHNVTAKISINFSLHEHKSTSPTTEAKEPMHRVPGGNERPAVLVSGAAGGVGTQIVRQLMARYHVICLVRSGDLADDVAQNSNVSTWRHDITADGFFDDLNTLMEDTNLFGIVHAAWPTLLRGGLLSLQADALRSQMDFGSIHLINLARVLAAHASKSAGGRLIALGSDSGINKPRLSHAGYSLGKSTLEQTIKLLAPELAPRGITVNAICPNQLPIGMNERMSDKQKMIAAAHIPIGRLCETADVTALVDWLLSPGASFVSGQAINLTGGGL